MREFGDVEDLRGRREMTTIERKDVIELSEEIRCSPGLAKDLLFMAGGDKSIVKQASADSTRLDEVKAKVLDLRISKLERKEDEPEESTPQILTGIVSERA